MLKRCAAISKAADAAWRRITPYEGCERFLRAPLEIVQLRIVPRQRHWKIKHDHSLRGVCVTRCNREFENGGASTASDVDVCCDFQSR
jgi:hypothetical protein